MDPERAAKEAAAITTQGTRRRTKPPSLVLLDAATQEAMKKEAVLTRQHDTVSSKGRESTAVPSAAKHLHKRLKTEKADAATRTAARGVGLGALLKIAL